MIQNAANTKLQMQMEFTNIVIERSFSDADDPAPWVSNIIRAPPRQIDHTYHDYSNFPAEELPPVSKTPTNNFPTKLHHILSNPKNENVSS